jgi:hypothetical protein
VALLLNAFESMKGTSATPSHNASSGIPQGEKGKSKVEPFVNPSKATNEDVPESSAQAAGTESGDKIPYCFRCKTKGHAEMFCEICESRDHIKHHCSKFIADKMAAVPRGYAVEGLGFFHIAHDASLKHKSVERTTLIKIRDKVLSIPNVISELQRLIPGGWTWSVEATGNNSFKTVFPSKAELGRMVEWGVVHTKFQNAKLQIEERMLDHEVKYILPKVWIQFTGLPLHLRDYLVIWTVGSILGVTKDVDMSFTKKFELCHMHVMVINPNLIPRFVNVVIGEGLYELQFRVEVHSDDNNPQPMEMDEDNGADDAGEQGDQGNGALDTQ